MSALRGKADIEAAAADAGRRRTLGHTENPAELIATKVP